MSKGTEHTPGPWTTASRAGEKVPAEVERERDDGSVFYSAQVYAAADVRTAPAAANGDTPAQCHANARLIAAAPELLEALEAAEQQLHEWECGCNPHNVEENSLAVSDRLRTAIAKAKGETHA